MCGGGRIFWGGQRGGTSFFSVGPRRDQKKLATGHHKQMPPLPLKNDSSLTIKSWALSGNPQWYTEPPLPSAEQCTVPFLQNAEVVRINFLYHQNFLQECRVVCYWSIHCTSMSVNIKLGRTGHDGSISHESWKSLCIQINKGLIMTIIWI